MASPADPHNPRAAALAHAYTAAVGYGMQPDAPVWQADGIQAVAEGLVYIGDQVGRLVPEDARWREFLTDQARQIPAGVESAVRELLQQLEGQSLEFELRGPVMSLTDWMNQLANVRRASSALRSAREREAGGGE